MKNLTYKCLDVMKYTKDIVNSQQSDAVIAQITAKIKAVINPTHIAIAVPLDTNADFVDRKSVV